MSRLPRALALATVVAAAQALGIAAAQRQAAGTTATLCVPADMFPYPEVFQVPYPGGEEDRFKRAITRVMESRADQGVQYRIRPDALRRFAAGTDPADLLEAVPAQDSCPAAMRRFLIPLGSRPARPAPESPVSAPAPTAPAGSSPASDADRRCEALAGEGGNRGLATIDAARAVPACEAAAKHLPIRGRYAYLYARALIAAKRYQDAGIELSGAAIRGEPMAAYYLGLLAEAGLDGPPDLARAAQRYRQAGEAGVADADARLGALLIVEANGKAGQPAAQAAGYRAAAERLQRSVDRGATSGLANLGWLYERGAGVVRDPARAVRLYDQAAHAGDTMGAYRLGLQYLHGAGGVAQNEREACRWMEQSAQAGFPHAQAELGNCFFRGIGKPRDHGRAFEWFRQAANAGLARAQEIVGALYDTGDGVAEDPAQAVEWFRRSAAQGDPYGMFELGARLKMGRGVAPDERTATAWFEKAAAQGETASMFSLGLNYLKGEGGLPQDDARAARWFAQAAKYKPATSDQEVTLAFARMNLATLYANGRGVNRDPEQARTLYRLAADCPNVEVARMARTYLAVMPPAAAPARDAGEWSALVPPLVVGGLAVLTLDWMLHGAEAGQSASGASDTSFDWSTSYYARSLEERNNDRMMVGCFWNEASYLAYGHC